MVETESKEVGAGAPEDVKKMDVDLEVTNKDFEEVKDEDGKVLFSCVHCPYKNPTVGNTKKHITSCHVKPKTAKRSTTDTVDHDVKRKKVFRTTRMRRVMPTYSPPHKRTRTRCLGS